MLSLSLLLGCLLFCLCVLGNLGRKFVKDNAHLRMMTHICEDDAHL